MDSLFLLVVLFVLCIVVSVLGAILLFFIRNRRLQNGIFFALACWAFFISYLNAVSIPMAYMGQQMLAWVFGFLSAAAMLLRYAGKKESRYAISNILVTISIVSSALGVFLFIQ